MVHSAYEWVYVALVHIEGWGKVKHKKIAEGHGCMLELAVSVALLAHLLLLLDLDHKLEGTDQHVEYEVAYLYVEGAWEVVPVETRRVV